MTRLPGDAPAAAWYATAFDALYPIVYAHRTVEAAAAEAAFAIEHAQLAQDGAALDLCCGNGRHLVHLAERTPHAVGLDYSDDLLRLARRQLRGAARLVRGDMRALPFAGAFDAVFNFFTSFGYFPDDAENAAAMHAIAHALKPGGRAFIDYLNPEHVAATLAAHSQRAQDGYLIHEERWIDHAARRINKTLLVTRGEEIVTRSFESVRLYAHDEMLAMIRGAGLHADAVFGDYDAAGVSADRPRTIFVARKPR